MGMSVIGPIWVVLLGSALVSLFGASFGVSLGLMLLGPSHFLNWWWD
jgi:hypothetical protein